MRAEDRRSLACGADAGHRDWRHALAGELVQLAADIGLQATLSAVARHGLIARVGGRSDDIAVLQRRCGPWRECGGGGKQHCSGKQELTHVVYSLSEWIETR